ncbi:hypothetical protein MAR_009795 [Mya arenaria]|uniref:DEK-C domain-containing protein n=1 Tax=Mya arenaria TaxID=6604 RepID=A0ABY7E346_MYAAR|nr:hypothetical protein MAR_009795 [Mya arenaria]
MENYVQNILKHSDLSVVTKKHVRQKYKQHVGRELSSEEKEKINCLVLDFVKNLAVEQKKSIEEKTQEIPKPNTEEVSPGNKENVDNKPRRVILKDSGDDSSSSVSSLTGSDLEVDEDLDRKIALDKLREARDKKISMSAEKKKSRKLVKGEKAKRNLWNCEEKSSGNEDSPERISEQDLPARDSLQERLNKEGGSKKVGKKLRKIKDIEESDSDSGPMVVKKTSTKYKRKVTNLMKKKTDRNLSKTKEKELMVSSGDSEPESDTKRKDVSDKKLNKLKKKRKSEISLNQKTKAISETDSEDETLSTIAARGKRQKDESQCVVKKTEEIHSDTGNTPLGNKKSMISKNAGKHSDSELNMGNKPHTKKITKKEDSKNDELIIISEDTCEEEKVVSNGNSKPDSNDESPVKKVHKPKGKGASAIVSSDSSGTEEEPFANDNKDVDPDLDCDSELDVPLASLKPEEDDDSKKGKAKKKVDTSQDIKKLGLLKKICRKSRIVLHKDKFNGCKTLKDKINKCKTLLTAAGMEGRPTMKKAEEMLLRIEAEELNADNIISSETGRVMRKVKSIYARRQISSVKSRTPMKNPFKGLSDIVDSEVSD